MAGGHVCSLDPNCHDHSLLKTIDNIAKWWSGLLTSEVLLHIFQKLRIHYSKIWLKSFLNATVSLGRVGTNKQNQKTVTLGEEVTKGEATAHFGRLKRKLNFYFPQNSISSKKVNSCLKKECCLNASLCPLVQDALTHCQHWCRRDDVSRFTCL